LGGAYAARRAPAPLWGKSLRACGGGFPAARYNCPVKTMDYKLNHVLFSRKGGASLLSGKVAAAAAVIVLVAVVAVNWDSLTKTPIDRFREAYDARRFDEALQIALEVSAADPSSVEALQAVASVYLQKAILRQDFDASLRGAFAAAYAALELDSEDAESRRLLGLAFEVSGDARAALAEYARAFKLEPQNANIMAHLAAIYEKLGQLTTATDFFQRAVLAAPENDEARVLYARFLLRTGNPDRAIEALQAAASSETPLVAAEANRILSAALLKIGEVEKARGPAEKALALAPDSAAAMENYGSLLLAELFGPFSRKFDDTLSETRALADRAIALDPGLAKAYFLAFKVAYSQQDKAAADAYVKKLLEILPSDQTISEQEKSEIRLFIKNVRTVTVTAR
jgi:tetratricopeptide (TPR) repeat protein